MENNTGELDQVKRERDEALADLEDEREKTKLCYEEWEKDCAKALRQLAAKCGFEWDLDGNTADTVREHIQVSMDEIMRERDEAVATAAGMREKLERITKLVEEACNKHDGDINAIGAILDCIDANARTALSTPPSAHLERIQREAAAKELDDRADRLQVIAKDCAEDGCHEAHLSAGILSAALFLIDRAAELRGAK